MDKPHQALNLFIGMENAEIATTVNYLIGHIAWRVNNQEPSANLTYPPLPEDYSLEDIRTAALDFGSKIQRQIEHIRRH